MFLAMNSTRRILLVVALVFIATLFAGCGQVVPVSTATATIAPSLTSLIPSITPTATLFLTVVPTTTSDFCDSASWDVPWIILGYDTFHAFGATSSEIDEQLVLRNPQWQDFRQIVTTEPWTAGDVFVQGHGVPGEYGVNPSVLLVTVGMDLEWQIPSDGGLYSRVVETGKTLYAYYQDYYTQEDLQDAYPQIGNAATYALYRYFDSDLSKLEGWCHSYVQIYKESPLK
jgi:hypothetical protein